MSCHVIYIPSYKCKDLGPQKNLVRFYSISLHQQLLNFYMLNIQNEHDTQNAPLCLTLQPQNVNGFNNKKNLKNVVRF